MVSGTKLPVIARSGNQRVNCVKNKFALHDSRLESDRLFPTSEDF